MSCRGLIRILWIILKRQRKPFRSVRNWNRDFMHFFGYWNLHYYICLVTRVYSVESKNIPCSELFWHFPKRLGIFVQFYTPIICSIYARLQNFIQLPATLTKLWHIKHNHPVHIICSKRPPSAEMHAGWSHLIWHNIVTVRDNWIKICSLA